MAKIDKVSRRRRRAVQIDLRRFPGHRGCFIVIPRLLSNPGGGRVYLRWVGIGRGAASRRQYFFEKCIEIDFALMS